MISTKELLERSKILKKECEELSKQAKDLGKKWDEFLSSDSHKEFLALHEKLTQESKELRTLEK